MKKNRTYTRFSSVTINPRCLTLPLLIFSFGLFTVISYGFSLGYQLCNTNIVLYQSVLPEFLDILIDLSETVIYALAFSIVAFAMFCGAKKSTVSSLILIYLSAITLRRIFDLSVALILNHSLTLEDDLFLNLLYLIADLLLSLIVFCIASSAARRYGRTLALKNKASSLFKDEHRITRRTEDLYPFTKIYTKTNPLQGCMLTIAIILVVFRIFARLIYDIDYGAPEDFMEILVMLVHYLSDILIGVIFYLLTLPAFRWLFSHAIKNNEKNLDDVN